MHVFLVHDWLPADKAHADYVKLHSYCASKASLVQHMAKQLNSTHHTIVMDNYFSSPACFRRLREAGFHAVGTLRANSGVPRSLLLKKNDARRPVGTAHFLRTTDRQLLVQEWQDRALVRVLSTGHFGVSGLPDRLKTMPGVESVSRKQKDGTVREIPCPPALRAYQTGMAGVDHSDQVCLHLFRPCPLQF